MNDKEWKAYRHQAENDESPEVKTGDVLALLDEHGVLVSALKACREALTPQGHTEPERASAVRGANAAFKMIRKRNSAN